MSQNEDNGGSTAFDEMLDYMSRFGFETDEGAMDTLPAISKLVSDSEAIKSAVLPSKLYDELCVVSAAANRASEYSVSLVLPVLDTPLGSIDDDADGQSDGTTVPFLAIAFADVVPHTAFVLATGLPLSKSSRVALEDNGLTLQGLTLREAMLTARRASQGLDGDSPDSH